MSSTAALFETALLVEDELNLATTLRLALQKMGISTTVATHLEQARAYLEKAPSPPQLIVLDRMLPDGDGLTLCKSLRDTGFIGTILILTASGQVQDRVLGLDAGADDYLGKPFSWEELEARIRALARRNKILLENSNPVLRSAGLTYGADQNRGSLPQSNSPQALWQIDQNQLQILGYKGWVTLTPLEFKLASKLINTPRTILSRTQLLKDVWGLHLLTHTRTVDYFLSRLRKHFEKDVENPTHFLTIRGAGYKFEP